MNHRILVTGSRKLTDVALVKTALWASVMEAGSYRANDPLHVTVVHGGANGADAIAEEYAMRIGWATEVHVADWQKHGLSAGPIRNQAMVDAGADVCLAFPVGESKGTRDCIKRARAAGIHVQVFEEEQ